MKITEGCFEATGHTSIICDFSPPRSGDPAAVEQTAIDYAPLKRIGTPAEISHGVLYLASDEARFISGIALPIDGGSTAGH